MFVKVIKIELNFDGKKIDHYNYDFSAYLHFYRSSNFFPELRNFSGTSLKDQR
jgi:hypothetical protein